MQFECDACSKKVDHDPVKKDQAMPSGWHMHEIKGKRFLLCDSCGHPAAFSGGLAPILKSRLKERHGINFEETD